MIDMDKVLGLRADKTGNKIGREIIRISSSN